VTAGLAAFLSDPEPFIDGTRELAATVGAEVVNPVVEQASADIDWMIVAIGVLMVGGLVLVWRSYLRHRIEVRRTIAASR
jgi:hypothetical protein